MPKYVQNKFRVFTSQAYPHLVIFYKLFYTTKPTSVLTVALTAAAAAAATAVAVAVALPFISCNWRFKFFACIAGRIYINRSIYAGNFNQLINNIIIHYEYEYIRKL